MPKLSLSALGKLVRDKRGERRLRDAAKEIGISAATLMRIEAGRVPDLETFGKVCRWLEIDSGDFLGRAPATGPAARTQSPASPPVPISSQFRIERVPLSATA